MVEQPEGGPEAREERPARRGAEGPPVTRARAVSAGWLEPVVALGLAVVPLEPVVAPGLAAVPLEPVAALVVVLLVLVALRPA